jgi:hypothetical protein
MRGAPSRHGERVRSGGAPKTPADGPSGRYPLFALRKTFVASSGDVGLM